MKVQKSNFLSLLKDNSYLLFLLLMCLFFLFILFAGKFEVRMNSLQKVINESFNVDTLPPPTPDFIGIGEKVNVDYVQHLDNDEYLLGIFKPENKQLSWVLFNKMSDFRRKLVVMYIIRRLDNQYGTPNYELYLPKKYPIHTGKIERREGKHVKKHDSIMLDTHN